MHTCSSMEGGTCAYVPTARYLACGGAGDGCRQPLKVPTHLIVKMGHLKAERDGLGVDAVRPAYHGRQLVSLGLFFEDCHKALYVFDKEGARLFEARENAVSRMSEEVTPRWIHLEAGPTASETFCRNATTSCFGLLFYLGHPDSVNLGLFRDDGQVVFRDDAKLGPRLADGDLDVEPRA